MRLIAIIPARMAANRYPGKPLESLLGMPMIGHCYYRTAIAFGKERSFVATCDKPIVDYVESIGATAILTSQAHNRATTRAAEALLSIERHCREQFEVVVMVQGDEPLVSPTVLGEIEGHFGDPAVSIINIMTKIRSEADFKDKNNVKVVVNKNNDALYFSREPIPSGWRPSSQQPAYIQTGIIAFRRDILLEFNKMDETMLEQLESVDMNRVLETGNKIRMVSTEEFSIGVDTPEDLKEAEKILKSDPIVSTYLIK